MTNQQKRFFELAIRYEKLSEEMNQVREEMEVIMNMLGVNSYHQDPETQLVYKVVEPSGTFIYFRKIDFRRTNRLGENRGGSALSKKEATEAGFTILGKAD